MFFFFGITAVEYVLLMFCIELCYSVGGVDNLDLMSLMVVGIIEIEKKLRYRCFPMNFAKICRAPFK